MSKKWMTRLIFILFFMLLGLWYYLSQYTITLDTLDTALEDYLELNKVVIEETQVLEERDFYTLVLFTSEKGKHVALIDRGLNGKYDIRSAYTTQEDLSYIHMEAGFYYTHIIYGGFEDNVTSLDIIYTGDEETIEKPGPVFMIYSGSFYYDVSRPRDYRIHYADGTSDVVHLTKSSYNIDVRTSGSKLSVVLIALGIASIGIFLIIPHSLIHKKRGPFKTYHPFIHMEGDDMVKSQMRY